MLVANTLHSTNTTNYNWMYLLSTVTSACTIKVTSKISNFVIIRDYITFISFYVNTEILKLLHFIFSCVVNVNEAMNTKESKGYATNVICWGTCSQISVRNVTRLFQLHGYVIVSSEYKRVTFYEIHRLTACLNYYTRNSHIDFWRRLTEFSC